MPNLPKLQEKQKQLDTIAKAIAACKICKQGKTGKPVPGEGNADADIVFLGEAPGKQEAKSGRPFVGRAGKVLRGLLAQTGLTAEQVYITSPVKYLPTYVTPTKEDILHGKIHLQKQLEIINPKIIVLLGRIAAFAMLGRDISVAEEHGREISQDGRTYFLTYHPAAPLYSPKVRQELVKDFRKLKRIIKN